MGYRHSREEILDAAVACAQDEGVSQLSFGRVGRRIGVSDRVVVYYFATKPELVGAVLGRVGEALRATLTATFEGTFDDHRAFLSAAWPVLTAPEADPVFALFFESLGLAAGGHAPYDAVVPELVAGWVAWAADSFEGPPARRRREAEAAVALVDGLLLLRAMLGNASAARAAEALGVVT